MATEAQQEEQQEESFNFQTEAQQLLKLMVHSLYSNREVFLRELISNAADAVDRLRFETIKNPKLLKDDPEFAITIDCDSDAGTLSVIDNGIGMSREEVINNLGTIARSGTARFLDSLTGDEKKDAQLIGQFGVGFYSAFVVADKIEVLTRRADAKVNEGVLFSSEGKENFNLSIINKPERGTTIVLHLKEEGKEFLDSFRLRQIVRKYADHLDVSVRMPTQDMAFDKTDKADADDQADSKTTAQQFEVVNQAKSLWTRSRQDVKKTEYEEFYKLISHSIEPPLAWSHNKVEGKIEYTSLLFIPKQAQFDIYNRESPRGLKLYVQRVFIMDDAEQFLPLYLRFVRGVVDCSDLPLNVSRELLQEDGRVQTIRNALTKRVLSMLAKMAKNQQEDYAIFWQELGSVLKEGLLDPSADTKALQELIHFSTFLQDEDARPKSLAGYIADIPASQDKIYYLVSDNNKLARQSPHLEVFKSKGYDVLLCCDRIDSWVMLQMEAFEGKEFQDISRANLDLDGIIDADKDQPTQEKKDDNSAAKQLIEKITTILAGHVSEVRASKRLKDSPACLVLDGEDMNARMRQLLEATTGQSTPAGKPILELNLEHPLVTGLPNLEAQDFNDLVFVLFDQARIMEEGTASDPTAFVGRLNRLFSNLVDLHNTK